MLILAIAAHSAPPVTPSSSLYFPQVDGASIYLGWTPGDGENRIVIARQGSPVTAVPVNGIDYNANAAFGNGDQLLPGQFIVHDQANTFFVVSNLLPNTTYYFRIYEYNGTGASTEYLTTSFAIGSQSTVTSPSVASTNITFSEVTGNSMRLTWNNGNGANRIVIARATSAVNANPVDLINYPYSEVFASGAEIGSGNYAVYSSNGNSTVIYGLSPNTNYHFAIFEYNGYGQPVYLTTTPAIASRITDARPSVASGGIQFYSVDGASMTLFWTQGNGNRRIVVARAGAAVDALPVDGIDYLENANFQSAAEITAGQKVVYDNVSSLATVSGLQPNTNYHFRIYEYDGNGATISYLVSASATADSSTSQTPTIQASNVTFSNVSGNSMTVSWTNGNGERRLVLMKASAAVNAEPVVLTNYSPGEYFGSSLELGNGNYPVSNTTLNSVDVTNLTPGVTYHVAVYEFNGYSEPVYLFANPARGSQATTNRPTLASSALLFNSIDGGAMNLYWTPGNGTGRIIVARAGAPVDAIPVDSVDYLENQNFQSAAEITAGQRVVYDNASSTAYITGLAPATNYHYRIYEYTGSGNNKSYLTSSFANASQSTLSTPTSQASGVSFSNVTGNSMTVSWTNGNGDSRIILMKAGPAVDADPGNLTYYSANSFFGGGSEIGTGNFVIASGAGNSVNVTGLQPGVVYHVAVYEYNGFAYPAYLLSNPARANGATVLRPDVASSNLSFQFIEGASMSLTWAPGNGSRRIVVARSGQAVTAIPLDGIDYVENNNFQSAAEISPGQKVVYDNTSSNFNLSGLLPNTIYHFAVYEYNSNGSNISYLTTSFATGAQSTSVTPTLQSSNISFSAVTGNSINVGWTNGTGSSRLVLARANSPVNAEPADLVSYSALSDFGAGSEIGNGNFVVSNLATTNINVTNLSAGTTYYFSVFEYNGNGEPVYLRPGLAGSATTLGPPQTQASNAGSVNVTSTSVQLNWTNGTGNRRIVLMKQGTTVDAVPADNASYTANTAFGAGTNLGQGNYVMYEGSNNNVTITGLDPTTTYHFAVFEYNAFGSNSQFLITNPARNSFTTTVVLPVSLIEFNGMVVSEAIRLNWVTSTEQNSSSFEIERSKDAVNFSKISRTQAAGNSLTLKNYQHIDSKPLAGMNYYRLKMIDIENQFSYSNVLGIRNAGSSLVKKLVNPFRDRINLELNMISVPGNSSWLLYDAAGKLLFKRKITSNIINEMVHGLVNGMYILEISIGDKKETLSLIKY